MNIRSFAILSLALVLALPVSAQRKRRRVVKKPVVVEEPQEDPRITNMRQMTQQIVFIDSIVVDKDQFLSAYRLSPEAGSIMTCEAFFNKPINGSLFRNEMGNKIYFSLPDDSLRQQLYTSDKLGDEWSKYSPLRGISEGIIEASYPFMRTDGITFYFAGKGEESIGGYDIFMTRYDSRSGSFLKPENIGMPFNSEANDYMYAIDELNKIGYFVSDRRQPEGKVCVYIFIPSEMRKTYDAAEFTEQQIRDFADITHIADTWGDGSARKAALARLDAISAQSKKAPNRHQDKHLYTLVINDALTYYSANDFRSAKAADTYQQLVDVRQQYEQLKSQLDKSRNYYAKADAADKRSLRQEILLSEEKAEQLFKHIHTLEKQARNEEIKTIQ